MAGSVGSPAREDVSTEKAEIFCFLPESRSSKSSCVRLVMAMPLESRTTAGTSTRSTWLRMIPAAGDGK
jgi:hypothetical protein